MIEKVLAVIGGFIVGVISASGYVGVVVLMAIESANIPLPSEVIMPFAGYLVHTGELNLWLVSLAGGLGCTIGSAFSWWLGKKGGRPLVERYGRYVLLSTHDLDLGEKWFKRWGNSIAFFSRLLPIVRTFISFPAGIAQVPLGRFLVYTFIGSVIWSYFLAYIGLKLGENWEHIEVYWRKFDYVIIALILAGFAWWIWRHFRRREKKNMVK